MTDSSKKTPAEADGKEKREQPRSDNEDSDSMDNDLEVESSETDDIQPELKLPPQYFKDDKLIVPQLDPYPEDQTPTDDEGADPKIEDQDHNNAIEPLQFEAEGKQLKIEAPAIGRRNIFPTRIAALKKAKQEDPERWQEDHLLWKKNIYNVYARWFKINLPEPRKIIAYAITQWRAGDLRAARDYLKYALAHLNDKQARRIKQSKTSPVLLKPKIHFYLGRVQSQLGEHAAAIQNFKEAMELNPNNRTLYLTAEQYEIVGQLELALIEYRALRDYSVNENIKIEACMKKDPHNKKLKTEYSKSFKQYLRVQAKVLRIQGILTAQLERLKEEDRRANPSA